MDMYRKLLSKMLYSINECPRPCRFTKVYGSNSIKKKKNVVVNFNWFIKTTKSRYAYNGLEFLAEFGGYVGLFLGISVFDLRVAFREIVKILMQGRRRVSNIGRAGKGLNY